MEEKTHLTDSKLWNLIVFWIRMVGWLATACVAPIVTFSVKFGLFNKAEPTLDTLGNVIEPASMSLNGWGIIACIIIGVTASSILKEIIAAYPRYSLAKQCLTGFKKIVLPLVIGFFICTFLDGAIHHIMFCLGTLILCQAIAIPLNPLPKWRYEKTGVEEYSSAINYLTDIVKHRGGKSEKGGK